MASEYIPILDTDKKTILFWFYRDKDKYKQRVIPVKERIITLISPGSEFEIDVRKLSEDIINLNRYFGYDIWKRKVELWANDMEEHWHKLHNLDPYKPKDIRRLVLPNIKEELYYRKPTKKEIKTLEAFRIMENTWGGK
jgi:hypothetical protein